MTDTVAIITGPWSGAACLLRGLKTVWQPAFRPYLWGPLFINLVLYGLGIWAGFHYFAVVLDWLIPARLEWLRWLLWPLFLVVLAALEFFTFTLMANLIASPFYGPLAVKVFQQQGIVLPERSGESFLAALLADTTSELRRLAYFTLRAVPLLPLTLVPVVNFVASVLLLLLSAWGLSLEFMAYPMEAQGLRFQQQREIARARRMETFGFGLAVLVGLSIPVLNLFIPPAAVVGATLYVAQRGLDKAR